MTDWKWYSNGLKEEDAEKLEKRIGIIDVATYGLNDHDQLELYVGITYENGRNAGHGLQDSNDIKSLFHGTSTNEVKELEGKVIEGYVENGFLRSISVNESLIHKV